MAEKEAESTLDSCTKQPTSNNRDLELENQELKKKLDEALETCRSSRVYTREIELDKSKLEETLKINRLGENQFLISMEQQMRQRREWNRKCSDLQGFGLEPLTKKRKLQGEYIEDIKDEIKDEIPETMQKESDKSVEDTTDEIVVCGDDVVEEGGTIEDDSAFDFIDESVNDDDSNSSEHIEGNKTINENYDNAVVDLTDEKIDDDESNSNDTVKEKRSISKESKNTAVDLTDVMDVDDNINPQERKELEAQDSNEQLKAKEKITELTLENSDLLESNIRLQKEKEKLKRQNRVLQNKVNYEKQLVQNLKKDKLKDSTEIARLNNNLAVTKKKIDELNIDQEDLNKTKNKNKELVGEVLKIKEEINDSIKKETDLKEENEQLLQKVQDFEVRCSQSKKQCETSNFKLNSRIIQIENLKKMLKAFSSNQPIPTFTGTERDDLISQLTNLINQNRNLKKRLCDLDQDITNNRNEITQLKDGSAVKQLQEQIKAKSEKITHLEQNIINLKKGSGMLQEEREKYKLIIHKQVCQLSYWQGVYNVGENIGGLGFQFRNIVEGNNETEKDGMSRGAPRDGPGGRGLRQGRGQEGLWTETL